MSPGSYVISVAQGRGVYRHIRISSSASLLDLHNAMMSAFEITGAAPPSFAPMKSAQGKPSVRYSLNNTKNSVALRNVKLSDTEFASKSGMIYTLSDPRAAFSCRTIRTLDEPTSEPQVVRASGSSYRFLQALDNLIKTLKDKGLPPENLQVMEEIANLTKEQRDKLFEYYLAASNLYGIAPVNMVHEMYCTNQSPVSLYTFTMFGIVMSWREECRFSILDKMGRALDKENYKKREAEYVVEYTVTEGGVFQAVLAMQKGKPYYQPPEAEFLRYAGIDFVEQNEHYLRLRTHLQSLGLGLEDANDCVRDLQDSIRFSDFNTQELFDVVNSYGIEYKNMRDVKRMADLLVKMNNNTRTHLNCGHTPEEIGNLRRGAPGVVSQKAFTPGNPPPSRRGVDPDQKVLNPKTGSLVPFSSIHNTTPRPGRNDLCPCGSGKKFKHCCARPR